MTMISAIDVGERTRGGLAVYDVNRSAVNPGAVYQSLLQRKPMQGGGGFNPGAIRAQAAKEANEEKRIALEERRVAVQEQSEARAAAEQIQRRRMDEQQKQFERSQAIDTEYEKKLTSTQERYSKDVKMGQETEQFQRGKDLQARKDAFPQLMEGVYGRNPDLVKNYLNEFGSKKANISKVEFASPAIDPKNPNSMMITYEGGGTSFFKDPKEFYQNFAAFVDPKFEEAIYTRRLKEQEEGRKTAKAEREEIEFEGKGPISAKELADYSVKAKAAYKSDPEVYDKVSGDKKAGALSEAEYIKKYLEEVAGSRQAAQGRASNAGFKELKAPDGRIKREYDDGAVEILKDGKVIAAKDKNGNVINAGRNQKQEDRAPVSSIDYSTGEVTEEGAAFLDRQKGREAKAKEDTERKTAIEDEGKKVHETGTAEYTDKITGYQMKVTVYSDGTTKKERIESKKKKKRKKGNGEGDNGGDSGGDSEIGRAHV